jgi:serine/threonine protein phosphatase 1
MGRLFAISDIHGCFRPFYELVVKVIDLQKSDRLILLGDYIDRGDQSREVIDFIIELKDKGFNITPLTGNHEVMLVDSYNDKGLLPLWYLNSGMTTLLSFDISDIGDIGDKYLGFFTSLAYYESIGDFLFVHAGFNDLISDPFSDRHHMIWECRPTYFNPIFSGKTVIHGHRPKLPEYVRKLISNRSNVIPIDTGCVYDEELGYGFISALEVNSMELISVPFYQ